MTSYKVNRKTTFVGGRLLSKEESYADEYDIMSYAKKWHFYLRNYWDIPRKDIKAIRNLPSSVNRQKFRDCVHKISTIRKKKVKLMQFEPLRVLLLG